jgi:hypothetical protein
MASRQAVLLTPLESSNPRLLPSPHRINRVHPAFCKRTTFFFSCTSRMPFPQLLSFQIHAGMGGTPLRIPRRMRILSDHRESKGSSPGSRRFSPDSVLSLSLLEATLTRNPISVHSKGLTGMLTSLDATLTKNPGVAMVKPYSLIFNSPPIQAQYGLHFRGNS